MTAHQPPPTTPGRVINLMLTAGDPLADAVVAELDALGGPARRALDAGLRHGLASLDEQPPEAIALLLEQSETAPAWADPLMPHRGDVVSLSVPPMWFGLCSLTSALAHSYASPAVARLLARTGEPTAMASRRLVESAVWVRQTMRPGGLLRGAPGYVAAVQRRLLHARIRITALEGGWDTSEWGLPIGQTDLARMWLGLTYVPFRALAAVGIELDAEEQFQLYRYWSYVGHLLGLDENYCKDVVDHADAARLRDFLDSTTAAPDENSRALTAAMVEAQARAMAGAPGAVLSEEQLRDLVHSVLRRSIGEEQAERLGVPVPAAHHLLPLISKLNRQSRYWQTFSPASAGEARRRALDGPGPELIAAVLPGGFTGRPWAGADRPGVPAA
ncbi:hypothetical protein SGFS_032360 [Streptomyces graminofaciens]|uniref:ER-bound oxygenase mpaB/mpaB'/Rubber oxygenase catalytic domain-containing protein n=1 Tax=Streptomyces graminofaciens TaxID=68212 RepID=A0ABM7F893_9ACTN|nr:oxygenase MpaB family protein [Streptomyces graminofaciens]BBC31942.1 hypothetical protein SGFS_032360 [Streptomyces graminofaciens]